MTAVVLLCLPADEAQCQCIIDRLSVANLDCKLFAAAPGHAGWEPAEAAAEEARCVIFCWSRATEGAQASGYRALAQRCLKRKTAIGIELARGSTPDDVAGMMIYDLAGWRSAPRGIWRWLVGTLFLDDIVAAARSKVAGGDPPLPIAPRKLIALRLYAGIGGLVAVTAALTTLLALYQMIPWPRYAEESEWARLKPGSCKPLDDFRQKWPHGRHADQAAARSEARRLVTRIDWRPATRPLEIDVPAGMAEPRDEREARSLVVASAKADAQRACEGLKSYGARLEDVRTELGPITCVRLAAGFICGMKQGRALCIVKEPHEQADEFCP